MSEPGARCKVCHKFFKANSLDVDEIKKAWDKAVDYEQIEIDDPFPIGFYFKTEVMGNPLYQVIIPEEEKLLPLQDRHQKIYSVIHTPLINGTNNKKSLGAMIKVEYDSDKIFEYIQRFGTLLDKEFNLILEYGKDDTYLSEILGGRLEEMCSITIPERSLVVS